jgi:hypothetical protein
MIEFLFIFAFIIGLVNLLRVICSFIAFVSIDRRALRLFICYLGFIYVRLVDFAF